MSININRIKLENRVRTALKVYTAFVFMFVLAIPVFLFVGSRFLVESQAAPQECSGNVGSGQVCTGFPGVNKTWSCLDDPTNQSSTGYTCQAVDYASCTYLTSSGTWENCNCSGAIQQCQSACQALHANDAPGTYNHWDRNIRCAGCGQIVGCNCTIEDEPDLCPYQAGQVQILFNRPGETNPRPSNQVNLICGETVQVGIWDTYAGRLVDLSQLAINGNYTGLNYYTLNTTNNGSNQTFNFAGRIQTETTGFYEEAACRPTASLTCTPPQVDNCPYNRVDIQFSTDGVNFSAQPPQLTCGDTIYARVYETSSGNFIGRSDANLFMAQCQNGSCGSEQLLPSNSHSFNTGTPGPLEYRFRAQALRDNGNPYSEANCNAFKAVSCEPADVPDSCNQPCDGSCDGGLICDENSNRCRDPRWPNEPSCRVDYPPEKTVERIDSQTNVARVVFKIEMRNNTESTTFTNVPFRDTYNPSQLIYRNPVTGLRLDRNGTQVVSNTFNLSGRGTITHSNLASVLGPLGPGERYVLYLNFDATSTGYNVCNNMEWNPNEYGWRGDGACLDVRIIPPDTDL